MITKVLLRAAGIALILGGMYIVHEAAHEIEKVHPELISGLANLALGIGIMLFGFGAISKESE